MNELAQDPTLGPCPGCGTPLDGVRKCTICGFDVPDPRIGQVVAGKYRLDSVLGEGGMGIVYGGTHVDLGEPVAVKFLKHTWADRPEFRARFRREAVILAKLRHPGIVTVLDFGELGSELFMVMELIRGTSLSDLFSVDGMPLSRLRVFGIFDELLAVLETAHDEGIVHRDLKPENVMLVTGKDKQDRVKVLDFGIAYLDDTGKNQRLTETGSVRGTPQYMSPEQCKGIDVGAPSDVYSIGVMLFEALTGALPFDSVEVTGLMVQHMFVEAPSVRESGSKPDISRGLETLVKRALAKRPEERPTAHALREELASVARGTDAASFEDRGAQERTRMAALSRSDRAITGITASSHEVTASSEANETIVLWANARRASDLRTALSVHGLRGEPFEGDTVPAPPPLSQRGEGPWRTPALPGGDAVHRPTKALVVSSQDGGAEARVKLAKQGSYKALPILVVDVGGAEETAALIRAGASDVALQSASDDEIVKKLRRILRRGR